MAFIILNTVLSINIYSQIDSKREEKGDTHEKNLAVKENNNKTKYGLEDCVMYAINNNINIKLEQLNAKLKEINLKESKGNFLPSVNSSIGYGYNFGRAIDPTSNQFINTSTSFSSAGVSASVMLFEGFKLRRQLENSRLALASSEYMYKYRRDIIALQVSEAFLSAILAQEIEKNAQLKVENDVKNLEKTKQLVKGETQPKSTEINAESTLQLSQSQLTVAKNNAIMTKLQLKHIMKLDENTEINLQLPTLKEVSKTPFTANFVYDSALNNQNDLMSLKIQEEITNKNEDIAKSGYYPRLSLRGSLGTSYSGQRNNSRPIYGERKTTTQQIGTVQSTNDPVVTQITKAEVIGTDPDYTLPEQFNDNFNQSLSLNLSIPIFNNRRSNNNVQKARIAKKQATLNTELKKQQLRQNIEKAYQAAIAAFDNYNSADANLKALEEVYRMNQKRLEFGSTDFTILEIAKNNYFTAKNKKTQRKYELLFKNKVLDLYVNPFKFN